MSPSCSSHRRDIAVEPSVAGAASTQFKDRRRRGSGRAARSHEIRPALPRVESVREEGSGLVSPRATPESPGSFSVAQRLHDVRLQVGAASQLTDRARPLRRIGRWSGATREVPPSEWPWPITRGPWIADDPRARSFHRPINCAPAVAPARLGSELRAGERLQTQPATAPRRRRTRRHERYGPGEAPRSGQSVRHRRARLELRLGPPIALSRALQRWQYHMERIGLILRIQKKPHDCGR